MATYIVTGTAGFIGSHLAKELFHAGHDLVAIDNLASGFRQRIDPAIKLILGDIRELDPLVDLFNSQRPTACSTWQLLLQLHGVLTTPFLPPK